MSEHLLYHTNTYENDIINTMNHEMTLGQIVGIERMWTPKSQILATQLLQAWEQTEDNGSGKVQNIRSLEAAVRLAHHCKRYEQLAYEKFLENNNEMALECMHIAKSNLDNYNIAANEYNRFHVLHSTGHVYRQQLCLPTISKSGLFDLLIGEMQTGVKAHGYLKLAHAFYDKTQLRQMSQIASGLYELYKLSHYQHLSQQYPKDVLENHLSNKRYKLNRLVYEVEQKSERMWGMRGNVCLGAINGYGSRYYD